MRSLEDSRVGMPEPAMAKTSAYDVIIIGGGPAGSTAATLLAKAGRKVLVLEKERFPRFHIGESMLPHSMATFQRMGVKEKLDRICLSKIGAEFATVCGQSQKLEFKNGFRAKYPQAYQVERAVFDKVLLDHARESGAEVREETVAEAFKESSEGVRVGIYSKGSWETLESKFLLDCSGRNSAVGSFFKLKESYSSLKKIALYAHYRGVDRDASLTRLVRGEAFWFWTIPLSEELTSIGLVMNSSDFQQLKKSPEEVLESALNEQPMMANRMLHATRTTKVFSSADYSYRNSRLAGDHWLLVGDAAGFIDPIFSTGVFLAVMSGEKAADAIDLALSTPEKRGAIFSRYEKKLQKVIKMYLRFVEGWYTHPFAEVFSHPTSNLQLVAAVNAVLAGDVSNDFGIWWRMKLFYLVVFLQRYIQLVPKLSLKPDESQTIV